MAGAPEPASTADLEEASEEEEGHNGDLAEGVGTGPETDLADIVAEVAALFVVVDKPGRLGTSLELAR